MAGDAGFQPDAEKFRALSIIVVFAPNTTVHAKEAEEPSGLIGIDGAAAAQAIAKAGAACTYEGWL